MWGKTATNTGEMSFAIEVKTHSICLIMDNEFVTVAGFYPPTFKRQFVI